MKELAPAEGLTKLHSYLHRWALKADGLPFHTHACWLLPVRYHGELAMLKIATEDEERRGAFLMRWWDGVGAVRALAHEGDALLLERASGDRSLIDMARTGQDDEASRIMCQVAASLHTPRTGAKPELIPLSRRFESLRQVAKTHAGVFEQAAFIAEGLLAAQSEIVVLHGDIHHGNVLDAGARGWLAIDPKGLEGERAFDFANIFCNPDASIATSPGRLARQVAVIAEAGDLDPVRLVAWIASFAALSAAWHLEDGGKPDLALAVADIAINELQHRARP
jgi:streptomycin 6-kinase